MKRKAIIAALICICMVWSLAACGGDQAETPEADTSTEPEVTEADIPVSVNTLTIDALEMDYMQFGNGDKTMVILPGLGVQSVMGSADAIAQAYKQFADEYTVYLFERRNDIPETYSVEEMAKDTAAALRALGLEDIYLCGASMGGMISMDIAIEDPDLVKKVVIGSSAACVTDEQYDKSIGAWVRLAEEKDAEGLYLAFGEQVYPEEVFEQYRDYLTETAKTVTDEELRRFIIQGKGIKGYDVTDKLSSIQCPLLAIGAKDDKVLGGDATEKIAELLKDHPDCESYVYEDGYGHAAYDTAPDFKDRMQEFFSK